jgi:hypothetical protein
MGWKAPGRNPDPKDLERNSSLSERHDFVWGTDNYDYQSILISAWLNGGWSIYNVPAQNEFADTQSRSAFRAQLL